MNLWVFDDSTSSYFASCCFKLGFYQYYEVATIFDMLGYRRDYLGGRNKSNIDGS